MTNENDKPKLTADLINEKWEKTKGVYESARGYTKYHPEGSHLDKYIAAPFIILGTGDDGRAAFITEEGRLVKYSLHSISKCQLCVLCNLNFWRTQYVYKDEKDKPKLSWDTAINDIIRNAQRRDFNESNIRGRGAWRDGDKISYHDGVETIGKWDEKKIYLRLPRHDIGLNDKPINPEIIKKIKDTIFKMSFETPTDVVRLLGWSTLAPFAGTMKYRPTLLITGASGSGKTTVQDYIVEKMTDCIKADTCETSVPGIRGRIGHDSTVFLLDEADKKNDPFKKAKINVNDILAFARSNYSNNAPDAFKGTKEGGWVSYKMNSIFGIAAISPIIENIADENRIFRINMVKPNNTNEWKSIENDLMKLLNEKNCRAFRALVWIKLKTIFKLTDKIVDFVREKSKRDYRSSYADALLISAYIVIWTNTDDPIDDQINKMLDKYYLYQAPEEHRDEAKELIDRILDEQIEILNSGAREKITILECLNRIYKGRSGEVSENEFYSSEQISNYKKHASRYGIRVVDDGSIAIANNHHMIMKITGHGSGYNKIFKRHPWLINPGTSLYFYDGKNRRCTIIGGLLDNIEDDKQDEIPF